ncbi:hypothetical protein ZWY2020_054137 [Hordeum vulgare]|nr:hypothetical protein ZWY2020_054137 [Hordeum vulgare]
MGGWGYSKKTGHVVKQDLGGYSLKGKTSLSLATLTRLVHLNLSDSDFDGVPIPEFVGSFKMLRYLDLSHAGFGGAAPPQIGNLSRLVYLDLGSFEGPGITADNFHWVSKLTSVRYLDLGDNKLTGAIPTSASRLCNLVQISLSGNILSGDIAEAGKSMFPCKKRLQLRNLGLRDCLVGPEFPTWLQSQTRIEAINLGNAGISDSLPDCIRNFSSSITSLNVSTNNITGILPANLEQLKMLKTLDMRSNKLEGNIPDLPISIRVLDLSRNNLAGSLPHSFQDKELHYLSLSRNFISGVIPADFCNMTSMELIDLSDNNLSGELPNCWLKESELHVIDFSSNNLWGVIPSTLGSLNSLMSLHLSKNILSGVLPTSLQSCQTLMLLDLAENNLSGNIPRWIGESIKSLILVSLGSNQFSGEIPEELSQLLALQYLDLHNNKLSGPVPRFLGNLTALHLRNLYQISSSSVQFKVYGLGGAYFSVYADALEATWKGQVIVFERTLFLLTGIDLSANQLTGEIPSEIVSLSTLRLLNLSKNHIGGSIPAELGNLVDLESLDLSWNELSGPVPHRLASVPYLSYLNLSYNDLSGQIPYGNQLSTFDNLSYLGNENLCGPPLSRICVPESNRHQNHKLQLRFDTLTCLFTLLGFAFGISTVFTTFICSAVARKAYFRFTDRALSKMWCTAVEMKLSINRMMPAGRDPSMATRSQDTITCYELEQPSAASM